MAFPVLDERAEVVYHRPQRSTKRKLDDDEDDDEESEGRSYIYDPFRLLFGR